MNGFAEPTPLSEVLGTSCRDLGGTAEIKAVSYDLQINGIKCEQAAPAPAQPAVQPSTAPKHDFAGLVGSRPQTLTR